MAKSLRYSEASRKNLQPFKPGQSGNPSGRKSAGMSVKEWWNQMQAWRIGKLEHCVADPEAPVCQKAAARAWLGAVQSGNELDRILDHTAGKPTQTAEVRDQGGKLVIQVVYKDTVAHTDD